MANSNDLANRPTTYQVCGEGEGTGDADVGADPVEVADDRDERVPGLPEPEEVETQAVRHVDHLKVGEGWESRNLSNQFHTTNYSLYQIL